MISHHQKYIAKIKKAINRHQVVITKNALDELISQLDLSLVEPRIRGNIVPSIEVTKSMLAAYQAAQSSTIALKMCGEKFGMTEQQLINNIVLTKL